MVTARLIVFGTLLAEGDVHLPQAIGFPHCGVCKDKTRYPWVREVLHQVKRGYAKYEVRMLKVTHQKAAQRPQPADGGNQDGEGNHSEGQ